jgi:two-component system LytT family response regulator
MPEITGLDVAASLPAPAPLVVFVTAYDEYAIRAFDANAIDYLLKPYDQPRLQRALQRVQDRLAQQRATAAAVNASSQPAPRQQRRAAPLPAIAQLLVPNATARAWSKSTRSSGSKPPTTMSSCTPPTANR